MKNQELSEKQKPILSEKEAEIIKESIAKTFSLIEEGKAQLSNHDDEKVLLVIGKTGVGKSTLINYLSGAELVATKKGFGGYVLNVKEQVGNIKIGHSNVSETTVPNKWYDEKTGITYWDCPGFEDTKGAEQDIANAFYVQRLFNNPKLKLVVVVQETTFMEDRGSKFIDLIGKLGILLKDFNKFKDGLSLVVTKASPSMTTEDVKYGIGTYLEEVKNLSFVQKEILQFLSGKDGKVELFTTPREPGPISGEMRDKMLWMINNTKYVDKSEVNITVSDKSLLVVEEMAKNVNIMVSDSVRKICFNLENIYQKDIEQLKNANGNISKIKDSLQSLNIWNSLIQELVIKSDQANSTEEFVRQLDEKISANKIISEEKFKGLQEYLSYLDFFKTIHKSTEKSLKLKEWIKNFQDIKDNLSKEIDGVVGKIKGELFKAKDNVKSIVEEIKQHFDNLEKSESQNREFFLYKECNKFQTVLNELLKKPLSEMVVSLEKELIKNFMIKVDVINLRHFIELGLIIGEDNPYTTELVSSLNLLAVNINNQYQKLLHSNQSDLKSGILKAFKEYKDQISNDSKEEQSYKNVFNLETKLNMILTSDSQIGSIVNRLKQEKIGNNELLNKIEKNLLLLQKEPFNSVFEEEPFNVECIRVLQDLDEFILGRCEVLKIQAIEDTAKWVEDNISTLNSNINRSIFNDSKKAITFFSVIDSYIKDLNSSSNITDMIKSLKNKITEDPVLGKEVIIIQNLDRLVLKVAEFKEDGNDIAVKWMDGIYNIKNNLITQYEKAVQDQFIKTWDVFETDIESLTKIDIYKLPMVIGSLQKFLSKIPKTIGEFFEKFSVLGKELDFIETQKSLKELLENPNIRDVRISETIFTNAMNLSVRLDKEIVDAKITKQKFATNAIRQLSNDIEEKIQIEEKNKGLKETFEFVNQLINKLKILSFNDVKTFSSMILEKAGDYINEKTKILFKQIENDISDAEFLREVFETQVIKKLSDQAGLYQARIEGDTELIKKTEMRKAFQGFSNDVSNLLKALNDDIKTKKFLDSIKSRFGKNILESFSDIGEITEYLIEFWSLVGEEKEQMLLQDLQIKSKDSLNKLLNDYKNTEIPNWVIPRISMILDQILQKITICEEAIHNDEKLTLNKLDKAVSYFLQGVEDYASSLDKSAFNASDKRDNVQKLFNKSKEILNNKIVKDIAKVVIDLKNIKGFENLSEFNLSYKSFNELVDKEIEILPNQTLVIKEQQTFLLVKLKEYEEKAVQEKADEVTQSFIKEIDISLDTQIKKASDMVTIIDSLLRFQSSVEQMPQNKIGEFAHWLKKVINERELTQKITGLSEIENKDLVLDYKTIDSLSKLRKDLSSRIEWYKLLQNVHDKFLEESAFDPTIQSFKRLDDSNLNNFLDKLKISRVYNKLSSKQISELNSLTNGFFKPLDSNYNDSDKTLSIDGNFIRISDVIKEIQDKTISFVKVNANNAVYFDKDIIAPGINFSVIAPKWAVANNDIIINLNGKDAEPHSQQKADNASGYSYNGKGVKGQDGLPGNPGGSAGNFYGICGQQTKIEDIAKLKITANGGKGSNGQDGGKGSNGQSGSDAGSVYNSEKSSQSNGNKVREYTTDFGYIWCYKRTVEVFQTLGTDGKEGGNGGNGGAFGIGGKGGEIKIVCEKNNFLSSVGKEGVNGLLGTGGNAGNGGKHGDHRESAWDVRDQFWINDSDKGWGSGYNWVTRSYASNGSSGSNGTNLVGQNNPEDFGENFAKIKNEEKNKFKDKLNVKKTDEIFEKLQYQLLNKFNDVVQLSGNGIEEDNEFGYHAFFDKYHSDAMEQILKLRIAEMNTNDLKLHILKAHYSFNENSTSAVQIVDQVKKLLIENNEKVLVPYNINNKHWVGIIFEKQDNSFVIKYFDPQNEIAPKILIQELIAQFQKDNINFVQLNVSKQHAGNCGPEVIEDFIEYVFGTRIAEENVVAEHSYLFEQSLLGSCANVYQEFNDQI